jgi:O-acetyl-ADP-ribose deacetylase (regulator of RNase III)
MCLRSIAFPLLAAGKEGYPEAKAARLIVQGITERLDDNIEDVRIVCPEAPMVNVFYERLSSIGWKKT